MSVAWTTLLNRNAPSLLLHQPELFVSALASILGHLCMKTNSFHSTNSQLMTICIVCLYKISVPSPLLWICTRERRGKKAFVTYKSLT